MQSKNGKYGKVPVALIEHPEIIPPEIVGIATVLSTNVSGIGLSSGTELAVALAEFLVQRGFWDDYVPHKQPDPSVDELYRKGREDGEKRQRSRS